MDEQNQAILQLSKKQRADRQFLLSRLEAAFSKVAHLESEHSRLEEQIEQLNARLDEERAAGQDQEKKHALQLADSQAQVDKVLSRLEDLERTVCSNPYLAFSRAANSPKARDDPFNADYLAAPSQLATETSFAFATSDPEPAPKSTPGFHRDPDTSRDASTTWDLLNLGEDLPPLSSTIRQSLFDAPQEQRSPRWNGMSTDLLGTSHSGPELRRADSMTSSEVPGSATFGHASQSNDSRVMSSSSLPLLEEPGNPSSAYPPIILPDHTDYPLPPNENVGYPTLFEAPAAPPQPPAQSAPRDTDLIYPTAFSTQLKRRRATIKSQKIRFEQMCTLEANNVEQEVVRSWVFEALSKAGEMLKGAENCMFEAERADEELGWVNHESEGQEYRSDVQRGAEFRATKARNVLESAYSRLCSALDRAMQQQNVMTVDQKTQRSGSSAMKSLKQLLGRKESDGPENQEDPAASQPAERESSLSRASPPPRPAIGPQYTSPLLTAVDRLSELNASPKKSRRSEVQQAAIHRRTISDTPQFPPTPDPKVDRADSGKAEMGTKNGRMSEADLMALISQLEERRLALYRS